MYPILYTFRRCPYAIRARMALKYSRINVNQYEVALKNKPQEMIRASSKATVPVLILENGRVIDESIDIMLWALNQFDPDDWLCKKFHPQCDELIRANDVEFKPILDKYKYAQNSETMGREYYRDNAQAYLNQLNLLLMENRYLVGNHISYADVALFPFVRQFYMVDQKWFEQSDYNYLQAWLDLFLNSELFHFVMKK